jgi:hypothetical protein
VLLLCVVQFDNRALFGEDERLGDAANEAWCGAFEDCRYVRPPFSDVALNSLSPYWAKLVLMQRTLEEDYCEMALWLDGDAVIHASKPTDLLLQLGGDDNNNKKHSLLMSGDPHVGFYGDDGGGQQRSWWVPDYYQPSPFCAGVFGVRNGKAGRAILRDWLGLYRADLWTRRNGTTWTCEEHGEECQWAGVRYEQGAFHKKTMATHAAHIRRVAACELNAPCESRKEVRSAVFFNGRFNPAYLQATCRGALVCHFFGGNHKKEIGSFLATRAAPDVEQEDCTVQDFLTCGG